jgi:recombination protein RecA
MPKTRKRRHLSDTQDEMLGAYFLAPSKSFTFIHSGAAVLDNVLGGGWPLARVSNIIGDRSTGKTLLAIEAMANFARAFPKCKSRFAETEAAFDDEYADALGIPIGRIERPRHPLNTVEEFHDDIMEYIDRVKKAGLYILDSLDALSDAAELKEAIDKGSYGMGKAKKMSQTFRRVIRKLEQSNCHLMVISQTRQRINVSFGRQYTRSGGSALDFYASQILYLAHTGEIRHEINKVKRSVGVNIKVKCTKNKVGLPFRSCSFPVLFGYGIEDVCASIDWLLENHQTKRTDLTQKELKAIRKDAEHSKLDDIDDIREELSKHVSEGWRDVESSFLPQKRKYHK